MGGRSKRREIYVNIKPSQIFRVALVVKNQPANAGDIRDAGSVPGSERSPGGEHDIPVPVFLSGESQEHRSLAGYSPRFSCSVVSDSFDPMGAPLSRLH